VATCFSKIGESYDLIYENKDYKTEAIFVSDLIHENLNIPEGSRPHLLDIASGSSRHAIELSRLGYNVETSEPSNEMRGLADKNYKKAGFSLEGYSYSFQELAKIEKNYEIVTILFGSIGYLTSEEELIRCFKEVHRLLNKGGIFLLDFWNLPAVKTQFSPLKVMNKESDNMQLYRISETTLDSANDVATVNYTLIELYKDGTWNKSTESHLVRYFSPHKMKETLSSSGLEVLKICPFGELDAVVSDSDWNVTMVCKKT